MGELAERDQSRRICNRAAILAIASRCFAFPRPEKDFPLPVDCAHNRSGNRLPPASFPFCEKARAVRRARRFSDDRVAGLQRLHAQKIGRGGNYRLPWRDSIDIQAASAQMSKVLIFTLSLVLAGLMAGCATYNKSGLAGVRTGIRRIEKVRTTAIHAVQQAIETVTRLPEGLKRPLTVFVCVTYKQLNIGDEDALRDLTHGTEEWSNARWLQRNQRRGGLVALSTRHEIPHRGHQRSFPDRRLRRCACRDEYDRSLQNEPFGNAKMGRPLCGYRYS